MCLGSIDESSSGKEGVRKPFVVSNREMASLCGYLIGDTGTRMALSRSLSLFYYRALAVHRSRLLVRSRRPSYLLRKLHLFVY